MKPRSKKATKAEKERYAKLKAMYCIACQQEKLVLNDVEIHHITSGGRRIGNEYTIPLCSWHHRGIIPQDCKTSTIATIAHGPSLAKSKRQFVETYGTEAQLLDKVNRKL